MFFCDLPEQCDFVVLQDGQVAVVLTKHAGNAFLPAGVYQAVDRYSVSASGGTYRTVGQRCDIPDPMTLVQMVKLPVLGSDV